MLPPISQVILVRPPFFAAEVEVTESYLMWIVAVRRVGIYGIPAIGREGWEQL